METTELLKATLFVWALFITPKMLEYLLICGILRAGGDTRFCMVVDVCGNWLIGLPLAFAGVMLFHFPLPLVVGMVASADIVKAIICWYRYKQKKWICVLVDTQTVQPTEPTAELPEDEAGKGGLNL